MEFLVHQLLDKKSTQSLVKVLSKANSWEDGRKTAGSHASKSKSNLQLNRDSKISQDLTNKLIEKIRVDPLIKSFALPRKLHGLMFVRTGSDQGYGMHVDNAYMSSGRSDLSFTLFLSAPNEYEGGELCIQTTQNNKEIKLEANRFTNFALDLVAKTTVTKTS